MKSSSPDLEAARHELEATLNNLSHGQSIQIIRAFSYFSQLANIAEDQHHIQDITSAGLEPTRSPLRHRAKAPWPRACSGS
jgi:phosphoenolpyruvate carboxylase